MKHIKRTALLLAALIAALALPAASATGEAPAPVAQNISLRVFRNIPCTGTLRAVDRSGTGVTYSLVTAPKHGTLALDGDSASFTYTPQQGRLGTDSFTYCAVDAQGCVSAPATVTLRVERPGTDVVYADMDGNAAHTAAVDLAARGVFVGSFVGGEYFFEPERSVTRGEFVAMAMAAAGEKAVQTGVTGFCDDAGIPAWARGYAAGALACGLIRGVGTEDGVAFAADAAVTLGEAAAVIDRLLSITDVDLADYGAAEDSWSAQAAANLVSVSVLPSASFSGEQLSRALTRAETAQLLSAAMTLADEKAASRGIFARIFG